MPDDKRARFASAYVPDDTGKLRLHDAPDGAFRAPPIFAGGGGGLVSTLDGCERFARMLLASGRHEHGRLLARGTVTAMMTNQVTASQFETVPFFGRYFETHGWGFGGSVVRARESVETSPGRYGWYGAFGTSLYVDPRGGLVAILLVQRSGDPLASPINQDFLTLTHAALDD